MAEIFHTPVTVPQKVKNAEHVGKVAILPRFADPNPNDKTSVRSFEPLQRRNPTTYSPSKTTINTIRHHSVRYILLTNQFKPSLTRVPPSTLLMNPHTKRSENTMKALCLPHHSPRYTHTVQIWNCHS